MRQLKRIQKTYLGRVLDIERRGRFGKDIQSKSKGKDIVQIYVEFDSGRHNVFSRYRKQIKFKIQEGDDIWVDLVEVNNNKRIEFRKHVLPKRTPEEEKETLELIRKIFE